MGHRKAGIDVRSSTTCEVIFILYCIYFTLGTEDIFAWNRYKNKPSSSKVFIPPRSTWLPPAYRVIFWETLKKKKFCYKFCYNTQLIFPHPHTRTSTNIRFLKCEAGLPGGIFTFYVAVDEATADTGYVTVKSRDFLEERKVLPIIFSKYSTQVSNWEDSIHLTVSSSNSVAYQFNFLVKSLY